MTSVRTLWNLFVLASLLLVACGVDTHADHGYGTGPITGDGSPDAHVTTDGSVRDASVIVDSGNSRKPDSSTDASADASMRTPDAGACAQHCTGNTALCDSATGQCVQCLANGDCTGAASFCDLSAHHCVACLTDSECGDVASAHCVQGQCHACTADAQCGHIAGKPVCATGSCVQCTGSKYDACGKAPDQTPYTCDPSMHTCTTQREHALDVCQACISDAACQLGQLCVEQRYNDPKDSPDQGKVVVGTYCFWREDSTQVGAPMGTCANEVPFSATESDSTSVEGTKATVCGLAATTCPAYGDFKAKTCSGVGDDASCGDARFPSDGHCQFLATNSYLCTTPCGGDIDCKSPFACSMGAQSYCTFQ